MSATDESDEPEVSSHGSHALLTDLILPSHCAPSAHAQLQTWTFPFDSSSRRSTSPIIVHHSSPASASHSPSRTGSGTPTIYSQVTAAAPRYPLSTSSDIDTHAPASSAQPTSLFTTPTRSIFSSGPPTSSVSANTAQASMSAPTPVNSVGPLSALTVPSSTSSRRSNYYRNENPNPINPRKNRTARAEKDVDDLSAGLERTRSAERRGISTPAALSRLFSAPEASTPTVSKYASYARPAAVNVYNRGRHMQGPLLNRSERN